MKLPTGLEQIYLRYFAVHRCGSCRKILGADEAAGALCRDCRMRWDIAKLTECASCLRPARECTCMPKKLSREGVLCCRKLFFYGKDLKRTPEMRLLLRCKNQNIARYFDFLAEELCPVIEEELCAIGDVKNTVITFIPRSKRAKTVNGFDQSEELGRMLSGRLGIPLCTVFEASSASKEQKNLNKRERLENAKQNIVVADGEAVKNKYVILIDDMVTTGAGMSVCAGHLRRLGGRGVLCFSVASKDKV